MSKEKEKTYKMARGNVLIGHVVKNLQGEEIGKIDDIVVDIQQGEFTYAVVASGGFLGMGQDLYAIPWEFFEIDNVANTLTLKVEDEKLKEAPGFSRDQWPDLEDHSWVNDLYRFYGASGYLPGFGHMRAHELNPNLNDRIPNEVPNKRDL